jgi:hypothetical protein
MMATTIYVYLPDEAVPCWRPVEAISVGGNRYEIVSTAPDADIERWEFGRGSIVRCERRRLGQEDVLMAVERA